jgi:phthiocerol/phenolphthiocerol synthesis type-I polyketide synthase C
MKARTFDEIESWLIERVCKLAALQAHEIDADRPFADYQLDSSAAVSLSAELSHWLGTELAPVLLWERPTIRAVAALLAVDGGPERHVA